MTPWCCGQEFASWDELHEHREIVGIRHLDDDDLMGPVAIQDGVNLVAAPGADMAKEHGASVPPDKAPGALTNEAQATIGIGLEVPQVVRGLHGRKPGPAQVKPAGGREAAAKVRAKGCISRCPICGRKCKANHSRHEAGTVRLGKGMHGHEAGRYRSRTGWPVHAWREHR